MRCSRNMKHLVRCSDGLLLGQRSDRLYQKIKLTCTSTRASWSHLPYQRQIFLQREDDFPQVFGSVQVASESCLPSLRTHLETRPTQKPEDPQGATDVRKLSNLVSKVLDAQPSRDILSVVERLPDGGHKSRCRERSQHFHHG